MRRHGQPPDVDDEPAECGEPEDGAHDSGRDASGDAADCAPPPTLAPARPLRGGTSLYEIIKPLGAGSMGQVFHARRLGAAGFEREVALKRIHTALERDGSFRKMFVDEARLAAKLRHPGIASVFDLVEEEDGYTLVMEYVEGRSLKELLALCADKRTTLDAAFACYIAAEVAEALHHAHELKELGRPLGIVHRDVSPHNIMVASAGEVKLLDFGVAYSRLEGRENTRTGVIKGKTSYLSPEQALGEEELDGRSDQFSLAVVLVEMLTGQRVFDAGTNEAKTLHRVAAASDEDVHVATKHLSLALRALIAKALARTREARYATCADFAQALREYLASSVQVFGPRQAREAVERLLAQGDAPPAAAPLPGAVRPVETCDSSRGDASTEEVSRPTAARVPCLAGAETSGHAPRIVLLFLLIIVSILAAVRLGGRALASAPTDTLLSGGVGQDEARSSDERRQVEEARPIHPEPVTARVPTPVVAAPLVRRGTSLVPSTPVPGGGGGGKKSAPRGGSGTALELRRRSLATSMATRFMDEEDVCDPRLIPPGTLLAACSATSLDTERPTPLSAFISEDVTVGEALVVPKGALLVCDLEPLVGARAGGRCDTLTIPGRRSLTFTGHIQDFHEKAASLSPLGGGTCFRVLVDEAFEVIPPCPERTQSPMP